MQQLGQTRSARQLDHLLQTPDSFVRAPLPGMLGATAIVHAAPAIGADFLLYTAEFEPGGSLPAAGQQRFLYVMSGQIAVDAETLESGGFAYAGPATHHSIVAAGPARAAVFERRYQELALTNPPAGFTGRETEISASPLGDAGGIEVRGLIPDDPSFDFRVNVMTYQPGATLPNVEIHVMEHGLVMLEGGGIYRLGASWYPVATGDVIWMAPFCPQWFGALGTTPAKYLIYKDWARHPLATELRPDRQLP